MQNIRVIDSHTGGEPTRVIVEGGPDLGQGSLAERRDRFRTEFDQIRSAVVNEPRGFDAMVGALLCEPHDDSCQHGVIFFNNVGYINMCVHGTIGLAVTLAHMNQFDAGADEIRIETPVGIVTANLEPDGRVTVGNVPSYRWKTDVEIDAPKYGVMHGDIAWGGNWFFLVNDHGQEVAFANRDRLHDCSMRIRDALDQASLTGADGGLIDHIELFAPPLSKAADSKNYVLCPGGEYDRSPCGTGTSAKVACLIADGKLSPGQVWRQEGIVGSIFEAWGELSGKHVRPYVRGAAHITADSNLIIDPSDPLRFGIGKG